MLSNYSGPHNPTGTAVEVAKFEVPWLWAMVLYWQNGEAPAPTVLAEGAGGFQLKVEVRVGVEVRVRVPVRVKELEFRLSVVPGAPFTCSLVVFAI